MNLIEKGYGKGSPVYNAFEEFDIRMYLSESVMRYTEQMIKENENLRDDIEALENKSLVFPKMANALFLTLYGDFEFFINSLCKAYKESNGHTLKVDELKGDGIKRAFHYLDRVVEIENVKNNTYHEELQHWNVIRNYLIHNSAIIDEKCTKSMEKLGIGTALSLGNEIIQMKFEDCERFINTINKILEYLLK
ncbi:hypothetical protein [Bacillus cereus]|uniref:RiboL-PSP-HEPN domain-containing protein n=1 Tax=Bacillus cereus TaxID=1396 RepID=A0A2A8ZSH5_BACCE|nr:hypothetical protein [Bacillus cereus]PFE06667.1 hypothetical protein CN307_32665 [Bacillus cereus]